MKHTQGDWKIDREKDCIRMNGIVICKLGHNTAGLMMPENQEKTDIANAQLLVTASELLAALEAMFEECSMIHKHWGESCNQKQADAAIKAGREAIAKATT